MTLSFLPIAASTDKPSAGASLSTENSAVLSAASQKCVGQFSREPITEAEIRHPLSAEAFRAALHYEPSTGVFTWISPTARRTKVGDVAGRVNRSGYWLIHLHGKSYPAHHVAWLYVHGAWPAAQLDHKNRVRTDNRIENLREATGAQNRHNLSMFRNNTSGFKGVSKGSKNRWVAEIMSDRRAIRLGSFKTPEEASEAYLAAKRQLHTHFIEGQGVRHD